MLAHRIIPTMLVRGRNLVKGRQFAGDRHIGNVAQAVRIHQMREVDELVILDIGATAENRGPDLDLIESLAGNCFMPLAVGGGIKTVEQAVELIRRGADKVVVGKAALDGAFIRDASDRLGRQAIVVSVDVSAGAVNSAAAFARHLERAGAGEILLQSIDRDGTMRGYDTDLIREVSRAVSVPVIASGGCSGYEDMALALEAGADAVAAGALFQFTDSTPQGAAKYLAERGCCVRIPRAA